MLLVTGRHVWTGQEFLDDAAVLCEGDRIREVGSRASLQAAWPDVKRVGGPDAVVLPGLINAHHHGNGLSSFQRGVADDALEPWLAALKSAPSVDPYLDTLQAALGLLAGGYSSVALFQSAAADVATARAHAEARIRACLDVGIRVALGFSLTQQNFYVYGPDPEGWPPLTGLDTASYLQLLAELRRDYADEPRVSVFAAPSGPQWVSDEAWADIGAWTREHQVPLHTHCLESPLEAEFAQREYGGSVVRHLDELGALHAHSSLVHGVFLTAEELALMAQRGASLITNPGSNLRLRCGVSPVLAALAAGVNVALGTDGCTLGEQDDAFGEIRLLLNLQREAGFDTPALTWQQALHSATGAAAAVTPWRDELGTIAPGNHADLSVFDLAAVAAPWTHPDVSPLQLLVQRAAARHVAKVVVAGEVVLDESGPLRADPAEVAQRLQRFMAERELPARTDLPEVVREFYRGWGG